MAAVLVQTNNGSAAANQVTINYGTTPTQGNLLILVGNSNVITGGWSATGWTQVIEGNLGTNSGSMFYKIAGASETTAVTIQSLLATNISGFIMEFSGNVGGTDLDKTATEADAGSNVTARSSGTTATLSQAAELAIAFITTNGANGGGIAWTNSFTDAPTSQTRIMVGWKAVNATTAVESTCSWTTPRRAVGFMGTFLLTASSTVVFPTLTLLGVGS